MPRMRRRSEHRAAHGQREETERHEGPRPGVILWRCLARFLGVRERKQSGRAADLYVWRAVLAVERPLRRHGAMVFVVAPQDILVGVLRSYLARDARLVLVH